MSFTKLPSALKLYTSSYRQLLSVTLPAVESSSAIDHQDLSPTLGPTPNEPATGESFQLPDKRLLSLPEATGSD